MPTRNKQVSDLKLELRIPAQLKDAARCKASQERTTTSAVVKELLSDWASSNNMQRSVAVNPSSVVQTSVRTIEADADFLCPNYRVQR